MESGNSQAVFELRPMNLADLLDAVIRLYRHNFGVLIRIAAVVHIPLGVIHIGSSALLAQGLDVETLTTSIPTTTIIALLGMGVYWLLFFLTMPIVQGAMAKAVAQSHLGEEASVGGAYRFALRRWVSLLAATLLQGMAQMAAIMVPLIPAGVLIGGAVFAAGGEWPGVSVAPVAAGAIGMMVASAAWTVVLIKLFFGPLTVVLEDRGAAEALGRSWRLTSGHFIRVALTMLIVIVLTVVLTYIVVIPLEIGAVALQMIAPAGGQALSASAMVFAQLFLQPIQIIATVLLYYDLRMRKEGFDLVMMAETIGEPELATRTPQGTARPAGALYGTPPPPPPPPPTLNGATNEPADRDHVP